MNAHERIAAYTPTEYLCPKCRGPAGHVKSLFETSWAYYKCLNVKGERKRHGKNCNHEFKVPFKY